MVEEYCFYFKVKVGVQGKIGKELNQPTQKFVSRWVET